MDNSYATCDWILNALHSSKCREIDGKRMWFLQEFRSLTIKSNHQPADNVHELTFVFTALVFFSATQGACSHITFFT
jgi:hypothetical protein